MTTRKRVAAQSPARPQANKRKPPARARKSGPRRPAAYRTYAPELLANVRQRYEETPEPVPLLAADLGILPTSFYRLARERGWLRRNDLPRRDVPAAMKILQDAQALEAAGDRPGVVVGSDGAASLPPLEKGRSPSEARRAGIIEPPGATPTRTASQSDLPLAGGGEPADRLVAIPELPTAAAPELSIIERLQRAVVAELATIEAMRAAMGTLPQKPPGAARTVRTLSMLTQTMQHLQRLRASAVLAAQPGAATDQESNHDDMPADIDEFRNELARRINAFVASRTESGDADRDAGVAPVEQAQ